MRIIKVILYYNLKTQKTMSKLTLDQKLEAKLPTGIVCFQYRKTNGEVRYAAGTTDMSLIPAEKQPKTAFKTGAANVTYYDFAKMGVRSLQRANVIRIAATVRK